MAAVRRARFTGHGHCLCRIATAFVAALVAISACTAATEPLEQPVPTSAAKPTLTRNLARMHYVEPDGTFQGDGSGGMNDLPNVKGTGILAFDGACAYLHSLALKQGEAMVQSEPTRSAKSVSASLIFYFGEDMDRTLDGTSQPVYLLKLGYNRTRYDPIARALWVNQVGPMAEGSRVAFDGFYGKTSHPDISCPLVASGRIGTATLIPAP